MDATFTSFLSLSIRMRYVLAGFGVLPAFAHSSRSISSTRLFVVSVFTVLQHVRSPLLVFPVDGRMRIVAVRIAVLNAAVLAVLD